MDVKFEKTKIIGIAVRTKNENGKSLTDIGNLWNKFLSEDIVSQISNKMDDCIYCIYTNYESDHHGTYTTILGCKVSNFETIPDGMVTCIIEEGEYKKHIAKGSISEGIVYKAWMKIWDDSINRIYTTDFELYGHKSRNPDNAEVEIYVAVKH